MDIRSSVVSHTDVFGIGVGLIALFALTRLIVRRISYNSKLNNVPHVGPSCGQTIFARLWPQFQVTAQQEFFWNARDILKLGYDAHSSQGRTCFVASAIPPRIIISKDQIDALSNKQETILSHRHTISERFLGYWTGLDVVEQSSLHSDICQHTLVQNLPALIEVMHREAVAAIEQAMPLGSTTDGLGHAWSTRNMSETIFTIISRINSRVLVGEELCRDPEWLAICKSFPQDVIALAEILRPLPKVLRPLVYMFSQAGRQLREHSASGHRLLLPLVKKRKQEIRSAKAEGNDRKIPQGDPGDILQWLIEQSRGEEAKANSIIAKVLFLTMAGFHATTMQGTYTLLDLCTNQILIADLRGEINRRLADSNGRWTMRMLQSMWKMDSVLKEGQRLHPPGLLGFNRRVRSELTLPDGTKLPRSSLLAAPIYHISQDPEIWPNPTLFVPLRFYDSRMESTIKNGTDAFQEQFATPDKRIGGFGFGRYACPGRVFAATQLKLAVGLVISRFDVRLPAGQGHGNAEQGTGASQMENTVFFGDATAPNPAMGFEYRQCSEATW